MDALEVHILNLLVFPESYRHLVEETAAQMPLPVMGDLLKSLLHRGFVKAFLPDEYGSLVPSMGFDSDMLQDYHFQATFAGLKAIS